MYTFVYEAMLKHFSNATNEMVKCFQTSINPNSTVKLSKTNYI